MKNFFAFILKQNIKKILKNIKKYEKLIFENNSIDFD